MDSPTIWFFTGSKTTPFVCFMSSMEPGIFHTSSGRIPASKLVFDRLNPLLRGFIGRANLPVSRCHGMTVKSGSGYRKFLAFLFNQRIPGENPLRPSCLPVRKRSRRLCIRRRNPTRWLQAFVPSRSSLRFLHPLPIFRQGLGPIFAVWPWDQEIFPPEFSGFSSLLLKGNDVLKFKKGRRTQSWFLVIQ